MFAIHPIIVVSLLAQPPLGETEALPDPAPTQSEVKFTFAGGYLHGFDGDLDRGGELAISRLAFDLDTDTDLNDALKFGLRFNYRLDSYDFSSDNFAFGGAEPWEDIHTVGLGALFTLEASQDFTLYGGPVFQFAREGGADWGDSFTGGGAIAASFRLSSDLTLGGGVSVMSQLEDDVRIFPIIIVEWQINDEFRLTTQPASTARGRTGMELVWAMGGAEGDWEFALGGATEFDRFRLDDDAIAPDGVGENENTAFWLRASYDLGANARLGALVGLSGDGELQLADEDGDRVAQEDYDGAPFVGVYFNVRF